VVLPCDGPLIRLIWPIAENPLLATTKRRRNGGPPFIVMLESITTISVVTA